MTHEEFEKNVMEKLLDGNDEIFKILREQYYQSTVISTEYTGHGFFSKYEVPECFNKSSINGRIDDVMAKFDDSEIYYFILYITDGKIDTLEGFATLYEWRYNYEKATIVHCYYNKREFDIRY